MRATTAIGLAAMGVAATSAFGAAAQSVSGVHSPNVNADDFSVQGRMAFTPGEDGEPDAWAARFHVQRSLNDSLRGRLIVFGEDDGAGGFEYAGVRGEALFQIVERTPKGYASGVRLDVEARPAEVGADRVTLHWTNERRFGPDWRLRGIAVVRREVGAAARDGLFLQTRSSLTYRLQSGVRVGAEMFNSYGFTTDLGAFDDQDHALGPVVSFGFGDGWSVQTGALFGVTDGANDADLRFWIGKAF